MTSEVAARVDTGAGERGSRGGGETPAALPREAASQTALDALLRELLPRQGDWSDEGYLRLTDHGARRVEFTDGRIEALPMPTDVHQSVLLFLHALFRAWLRPRGGVVMVSGMRMRVREGKFREPDVLLFEGFAAEASAVFDAPETGA